jgi:hypothetical protein
MENLYADERIVDLLTKVKNSGSGYPSDLLAARRRTYLRQMANIGAGIGLGAGHRNTFKGGGNGATTAAGKAVEIALIAAIAIEVGATAYLYREKIAHAINSYLGSPTVQESSPPAPAGASVINPTATEPAATPSATASEIPSGTPSGMPPTSVPDGDNQNNNNSGETSPGVNVHATATPNPAENNGNHYGHTPKPDRTQENNGGGEGNNDGSSGGGGDTNDSDGSNNGGGGGNKDKP